MNIASTQVSSREVLNSRAKVLLADSSPEIPRKERIAAFKEFGFAVFPALNLQQARSRCKPGRFDLIAVVIGEDPNAALQVCDEILARDPQQRLIAVFSPALSLPERSYAVPDDADRLREKIEALFEARMSQPDSAVAA
jgi:hypothetical protein